MLCQRSSPSQSPSPRRRHSVGLEPAQACLLKGRGDLIQTKLSFDAQLPEPGARARPKASCSKLIRLGLEVRRTDDTQMGGGEISSRSPLVVSHVDSSPAQATPVAQWNTKEIRQADRGFGEHRQSFEIRPGDRIRAVNGAVENDDAMLDLLSSAASITSPKSVAITIEREQPDVLGPSRSLQVLPCVRTPEREMSPALQNTASNMTSPLLQRQRSDPNVCAYSQSPVKRNTPGRPPKLPFGQSPVWVARGRAGRSRDEETMRSTSCPMAPAWDPSFWSSVSMQGAPPTQGSMNTAVFSNLKRSHLLRPNLSQAGRTMFTTYS